MVPLLRLRSYIPSLSVFVVLDKGNGNNNSNINNTHTELPISILWIDVFIDMCALFAQFMQFLHILCIFDVIFCFSLER